MSWPPKGGWLSRLVGTEIDDATFAKFQAIGETRRTKLAAKAQLKAAQKTPPIMIAQFRSSPFISDPFFQIAETSEGITLVLVGATIPSPEVLRTYIKAMENTLALTPAQRAEIDESVRKATEEHRAMRQAKQPATS